MMQTQDGTHPVNSTKPRLPGIPTDDPQAALRFCRWLAANLHEGASNERPLEYQADEMLDSDNSHSGVSAQKN